MAEKSSEVDSYLEDLDPSRRKALQTLRALIHKSVPKVAESMQHRMPTFETSDILCSFASQKNYMSFYICNPAIMDKFRKELKYLNVGKGCIRFKKMADLPTDTIEKIIKEAAKNPGRRYCTHAVSTGNPRQISRAGAAASNM